MPASSEGSTQDHNRLFAYVVPTNRGPLPACSGSGCTSANFVWEFIHVVNANPPTNNPFGGTTRATLPNSFVVSSIDETILVDGVEIGRGTLTPPPNMTDRFGSAGRWPSTVTCTQPPAPPCHEVTSPAILPDENTVIWYEGWFHAVGEPNGTYVFRFTIHGALNGTTVDLTASSPPILMTN
jgi:hypothetical protein